MSHPLPFQKFYLTLDLRALALFRIAMALFLIFDWGNRWVEIPEFYSDTGLMPLGADLDRGGDLWHFSLLDLARSDEMVRLLFLLGLGCYGAFLLGYRTQLFTILSWIFFFSLVNRNVLIRHGGDCAAILLMQWAAFLPLGRRYSIDARRHPSTENDSAPSLAAFFLIAQIALIYLATAFAKCGQDWTEGNALFYAWSLQNFASPLGLWLVQHLPLPLIHLLTWTAWGIEWLLFFLILYPRFQPSLRRLAVALSSLLMLGIYFTMEVGDFPLVMIIANILLLGVPSSQPTSRVATPSFFFKELILLGAFIAAFLNLYNFNFTERFKWQEVPIPKPLHPFILIPQGLQNWKMFAANPSKSDGWYLFDGELEDGTRWDPWNNRPVTAERPLHEAQKRGRFWMKIYERLHEKNYEPYRLYWAQYVTRTFHQNRPPGKRLKNFKIIYYEQTTLPPGSHPPYRHQMRELWIHQCQPTSLK